MPQFDAIHKIVKHVRRKFSNMVFIGKDYSVADLCRDLERIEAGEESPDIVTDAWGALPVSREAGALPASEIDTYQDV